MTIFPTSIRAKLTLTAVTVMGVLFIALGGVVQIAGRQQLMARVDAELTKKVDEAIQFHRKMTHNRPPPPQRDPNRGPGGGPDDGPGPGPQPGDDRNGPGGPDGGRNRGPGPGPGLRGYRQAMKEIGDPLLTIGPRFISIDPGPPMAPPEFSEPYDKAAVPLAGKKGIVFSDVSIAGQRVRILTRLAKDDNGRRWVAQVPYPIGDIDKSLQTLGQTLLLLLPIGLGLTAGASLFLMKRVMRPIREITVTADSISAEDLSGRLNVAGKDEFAQLGTTINGMLGRLENAFNVQRETMARLEAVLKQQRRFTADASHELKTPLAVIKANTGLMLHGMDLSSDTRSSVEAIDSAATRMNRLVQGLMLLARAEAGSAVLGATPFDLKLAVQNAIDQVHRPSTKAVTYDDDESDELVSGSERDVERVFVNLIDNASRHTTDNGHIEVRIERVGNEAVVTVCDDGEGIAAEHVPHLFERFYRADSARSTETGGTGLGLAICKGIVEATGGTISIESQLGKGTTVTVRLPVS